MSNIVQIVIWCALSLTAVIAILLGIQNRGNQNLLFGTGTVIAAIVFYVIHLTTSLSETKRIIHFAVEITIDRSSNFIGAKVYSLNQSGRALNEKEAIRKFMQANPESFTNQEAKVCRDYLIYSTLT